MEHLEALTREDPMTDSQRETELEADAAKNNQLKTPVEARQGVKTHHVRWMLMISLTLGVVALGGVYAWYASQHGSSPNPAEASASHTTNS
jgi:hypothetical protein